MGWILNKIKDSNFFGNFASRDYIEQNILPKPTQMDLLVDIYKEEVSSGKTTESIIDELAHYRARRSEIRDLETKLKEAGLDNLVDEAEELKQLIAMLILKNQNYKSAQKIITLLLDEVATIFKTKIKPKVIEGVDRAAVELAIAEYLESEVREKLGENVLEIYNRQIKGMLYFLTGNCHLEWT